MKIFETKVQETKYNILREVAVQTWKGNDVFAEFNEIARKVIDIACDECPEAGYVITDLCRGCLAHSCMDACKVKAIHVDSRNYAKIDKTKCVECGRCAKVCKYSAIVNFQRPCEKACPVGAISMSGGLAEAVTQA